jgi:hypothetical protein
MSFLLRLTFLLALVCLLIPNSNTQVNDEARIDSTQAITLAHAAVSDARGFCERQPDACTAGSKIAVALLHKIEAGARALSAFVGEFISAQLSEKSTTDAPIGKTTTPQNTVSQSVSQSVSQNSMSQNSGKLSPLSRGHGTLAPADMKPSWHGSVPLLSSGQLPDPHTN